LVVLWLPGVSFPVISDTINYGLLGRSIWEHGTYMLNGVPYANHLPLHAFISYPFTKFLGFHLGMHASSLFGALLTLLATYDLAKKSFRSSGWALAVVVAVLFHPAFVLMAMVGASDLLFCALFLFSLSCFLRAETDKRWYVLAGILAGLSVITRYNGLPLFPLFLGWVAWKRRNHLRSPYFWTGLVLGGAIFGGWLLRNQLAFGNALHTGYVDELASESPNPLLQLWKNFLYYLNPVHNVFPFFFVFAICGFVRYWKKYLFLTLAIVAGSMISAIWWVQGIRFMFPALVLLLFFAILCLRDVTHRTRSTPWIILSIITLGILVQSTFLCMYTYGQCNAFIDRTVHIFPANIGVSSEGVYAWSLARDYINANAEPEAVVLYEFPQESKGIFRDDLQVSTDRISCPWYKITQKVTERDNVVFTTDVEPKTSVVKQECVE
jgi:4-amino-4-deoxy-L-arabinose transferase-like glycosyltransferase